MWTFHTFVDLFSYINRVIYQSGDNDQGQKWVTPVDPQNNLDVTHMLEYKHVK